MNVKVEKEFYTVELCQSRPKDLFVFGDNFQRYGKGGQAIIRDEFNSMGIATKESSYEYWYDNETYLENCQIIDMDIARLKLAASLGNYENIVLPAGGLGTGLSDMPNQCPKTFIYLCKRLWEEFKFNNIISLTNETK